MTGEGQLQKEQSGALFLIYGTGFQQFRAVLSKEPSTCPMSSASLRYQSTLTYLIHRANCDVVRQAPRTPDDSPDRKPEADLIPNSTLSSASRIAGSKKKTFGVSRNMRTAQAVAFFYLNSLEITCGAWKYFQNEAGKE